MRPAENLRRRVSSATYCVRSSAILTDIPATVVKGCDYASVRWVRGLRDQQRCRAAEECRDSSHEPSAHDKSRSIGSCSLERDSDDEVHVCNVDTLLPTEALQRWAYEEQITDGAENLSSVDEALAVYR